MAGRCVLVEFIGIPGAGKSTLAAALAARLSDEFDVDLPDRFDYRRKKLSAGEKLRLDTRYAPSFLRYRLERLAYDVLLSGVRVSTIRKSWDRSRYPLVLLGRTAALPRRFCILDEWLLHRTIHESIYRYGANANFSLRFALPPRTSHRLVYVCVNVDKDLACQRVLEQPQPFRTFAEKHDRREIDETLSLWSSQLEILKRKVQARGFLSIDVDGGAPIEETIAALQEQLRAVAAADEELGDTIEGEQ